MPTSKERFETTPSVSDDVIQERVDTHEKNQDDSNVTEQDRHGFLK